MAATRTKPTRSTNQRSRRNMPQPTAPPVASPSLAASLIRKAKELEAQRQNLYKSIEANRRTLRDLDQMEMLDEDEGQWLDVFYPKKSADSKRSDTELEATRKLRIEAVKEVRGSEDGNG